MVFDAITRERLDDHPGAMGILCFANVGGSSHRVAHVVQAIEESNQIELEFGRSSTVSGMSWGRCSRKRGHKKEFGVVNSTPFQTTKDD